MLGLVSVMVLASCGGGGGGGDRGDEAGPPTSAPGRQVGLLTVKTLHSLNGQHYTYRRAGDEITVTAPRTNEPSELGTRIDDSKGLIGEAFWDTGQPKRTDQQVCVQLDSVVDASSVEAISKVLDDPSLRHLPGIALRVQPGVDGGPGYAITVTQRVNKAGIWGFDVNALRIDDAGPVAVADPHYVGVAEFGDVAGTIEGLGTPEMTTTMKPPPWNLCARIIGTTITVKLWFGSGSEPAWSDPEATRKVKVGRSWVFDGYAGAYEVGLAPGRSSKFTGLMVTSPY